MGKRTTRPREKTAGQKLKQELKQKRKELKKRLAATERDLRSLGVNK